MNNKKGYTLIEIIVTFMLISMFLLAATVITTSCMKVYLKVKSISNGQTVADSLTEKINGELSAAQKNTIDLETGASLIINDEYESGSNSVTFVNQKGIKVTAGLLEDVAGEETKAAENGKMLVFHYYSDKKDTDWYYGRPTYHGYDLDSVKFSRLPDTSNVIRVDIVLKNAKTGYEFTTYKIIECYNLVESDIEIVT